MLEYYNWINNPDYSEMLQRPIITTDNKIKKSKLKRLRARLKRKRKNNFLK